VTDSDLLRALSLLKLSPEDIRGLRQGSSSIDAFRQKAKSSYRKAALTLHPDKTGNDEAKTADFVLLNRFMEELDALKPPKQRFTRKSPNATLTVRVTIKSRVKEN
jgi:hypothetical protein